jgi:hypothetical protein
MKIQADAKLPFPRELVYRTYRDKLPQMVQYLPNVKNIEVLEQKPEGSTLHIKNLWWAKAEIPKIAQSFIKPEMLSWFDFADWHEDRFATGWRIQLRVLEKAVSCAGENQFEAVGDTTIIHIRGELSFDLREVPGVPRFLAGSIGPTVEKFVVGQITPNLLEVSKGIEQYLRANPQG